MVFTLAPSPVDGRVIWAGSDDGYVHVTRDGGELAEGHAAGSAGLHPHQLHRSVAARRGTAYFAGNRYQRADRAPYVYKTNDYGKTWTKIVARLPPTDFARAIREDKKREGLLFLGTENGIYVSFDDGEAWQSLRLDLPVTPVHGIEVKGDDLVIATHGRSFYIMDNISVLRQVSRDTATDAGGAVQSGGCDSVGLARRGRSTTS